MSFNEYYFSKATEQLESRRNINRNTEAMRHREVVEKIPEYANLEALLAETSSKLIMIMLQSKEGREEKLSQLEKGNLSLQRNMDALLVQAGFPADYLAPIYTCTKCKDKGTLNGKWCECFRRLMLSAAAEDLNSVSPLTLSTFDSFNTNYYSDEKDINLGTSPRAIMKHNLDFCRRYAEQFTPDSPGIFMNGGTGLGKTHLSLAIADGVIKKGYSAIYGSVPELLRVIEKEYYGKSENNTMDSLTQCDLLILDDLGAEMDKPLYTSMLYEIINARISRSLPMIVNTNIGASDLKDRYQDRIWSRLFSFEVLMFVGTDVRRKLPKNSRTKYGA